VLVFRDSDATGMGRFAINLSIQNALLVELMAIIVLFKKT